MPLVAQFEATCERCEAPFQGVSTLIPTAAGEIEVRTRLCPGCAAIAHAQELLDAKAEKSRAAAPVEVVAGEPVKVKCIGCGVEFESPVSVLPGDRWNKPLTLFANECDSCSESRKAGIAAIRTQTGRPDAGWFALVGTHYAGFDAASVPQAAKFVADRLLAWKPGDPWRGIGLIGPTATGKSFLLHELGRRLWVSGVDVFPTSGVQFAWKTGSLSDDREEYRRRCCTARVLLLDDADKLKLTEGVEADYYGVLELRRRDHLPVLATLNIAGSELAALGSDNRGSPIVTRLRELCEFLPVG